MTGDDARPWALGVDVGASYVRAAAACDASVALLAERPVPALAAEHDGDLVAGIAALITAVRRAADDAPAADASPVCVGAESPVGIGVPAIVRADGSLRAGLSFGIPGGSELRERLEQALGVDVVVDNDASLAALGEAHHGAGHGEGTLALVTLGTNIGMGIVVDGAIYRGVHGAAGELGTVALPLAAREVRRWELVRSRRERNGGPVPAGGYVFIEELYGGQALSEAWLDRVESDADGAAQAPGAPLPAAETRVLELAAAGDERAAELVHEAIAGWALAIAAVHGILDPGAVLIGGGIAPDLLPFLGRLRAAVAGLMPGRAPRIEIATLGPLAGLIGAAVAARQHAAALTGPMAS